MLVTVLADELLTKSTVYRQAPCMWIEARLSVLVRYVNLYTYVDFVSKVLAVRLFGEGLVPERLRA